MVSSLRDKAVDLRRQHILEAAARVFARRGFHRSTIRDIAKEAGIADGTIYNAFENKTALLLALLDPLDERSTPLDPSPWLDDVEGLIREMLRRAWTRFNSSNLEVLRTVLSESLVDADLRQQYLERIIRPAVSLPEPVFAKMVADGRIRSCDPALATRAVVSTVMGFVTLRLLGDADVTARWDALPNELADLLLNGLLPAKGSTRS